MPVTVPSDQSAADPVMAVRVQALIDAEAVATSSLAAKWADGLKSLVGVSGGVGLVTAPMAAGSFSAPGNLAIGLGLAGVIVTATAGLALTMSAAYGTTRTVQQPRTLAAVALLQADLARESRTHLRQGRALALLSCGLLALTIIATWAAATNDDHDALVEVTTTEDVSFCGTMIDAPVKAVAVHTASEGRVEIATREVVAIEHAAKCPSGDGDDAPTESVG